MTNSKLGKKEKWDVFKVAVIFMLLLMTNITSYYAGEGNVPHIVLTMNLLCVFLLVPYVSLRQSPNNIRAFLTMCYVLMLIMSLFNFSMELSLLTVFVVFCLMLFGTYSKEWDVVFLSKVFLVIGILAIPVLVWQLTKANLDIGELLKRRYTWTEIFAYTTITGIWIPMVMLSFLTKKGLLVSLFYWGIAFVFNMISLKRSIVVDSLVVFSIILIVSRKIADEKTKKYLYFVFALFIIAGTVFITRSSYLDEISDISEAMTSRFTDTADDVSEFDRWVESKNYFEKEASFFDVVFGKGWFSVQHGIVNRDRGHAFLHIGWLNFIFKGGLFFLITVLLGYKKVITVVFHPDLYSREKVFEAMFCFFYFFNFFYSHVMSLGIDLFFYFYCLVHVNDRMDYSNKDLLTSQPN